MRQAASPKARNAMTRGLRWADQKKNRWCVGSLQIKGFKYGRMSCLFNEVILNPNPANRRVYSLDSFSVFNSRFLTVFIEFIIKPHHKIAEILMTNINGSFHGLKSFAAEISTPLSRKHPFRQGKVFCQLDHRFFKKKFVKGEVQTIGPVTENGSSKKNQKTVISLHAVFPHEKWPSQKGEKTTKVEYLCELPFLHLSLVFFLGSFLTRAKNTKTASNVHAFQTGNYGILIFTIYRWFI